MTESIHGLGRGIYTPREAARLTSLRSERVMRWVRGYEFIGRHGKVGKSAPIFQTDWETIDGRVVLSFLDLVELLFVRTFLGAGVSMPTIRRAAEEGAKLFQTQHPFCVKRFETDGRDILVRLEDDVLEERLVDLVRKQAVFKEVFNPLLKQLRYDVATEIAAGWWPRGKSFPVLLDPTRSFGEPLVAERFVPTRALAGPVNAGDDIDAVAAWFEVPRRDVEAAVEFENGLTAVA